MRVTRWLAVSPRGSANFASHRRPSTTYSPPATLAASAAERNVTKPKPRERREVWSRITSASSTSPYWQKNLSSVSSSVK